MMYFTIPNFTLIGIYFRLCEAKEQQIWTNSEFSGAFLPAHSPFKLDLAD